MNRSSTLTTIAAFALCVAARGFAEDAAEREYVDPRYQFNFRYPADWTLDTTVKEGAGGETVVAVRDPRSSARAVASIGKVGKSISKAQFDAMPKRDEAVTNFVDVSLRNIYERASKELHATRMIVSEKKVIPSDQGIKFYISTGHIIEGKTVVIAGMHVVPFDQAYMISFIMISPFKVGGTEQSAINKVFNSFRLVSEPAKK